ncbi:DUF6191 domain-containing protein [Umezawaea beigongshangensis]|uniref:DUF6191 domain-containing protein n=1 Tax=Umezawaea beigongshangensis TaxID=2780383 RepID=UPI0018F1DB4C|nr:DUF6191 domain-containing protein [Umezawaea beigongshangensis]
MGWLFAVSLPGLVCLLVVLAALERIGLWVRRRSWLPWRRDSTGASTPISAIGFEELGAALYAGKRDELEHRESERRRRDDADDGAPPHTTVDLDARIVRLRLPP